MKTACIEWTGGKFSSGYGAAHRNGKTVPAHRAAWERERGPIPAGMFVCHHCDNRACVNVDHLFLGTQADNIRDASTKGRMRSGAAHPRPMAKLSSDEVKQLREAFARGESRRALARRFGIGIRTMYDIATRVSYRHVE